MLEELDNQGPEAQRLIRRAVIAVSNGPGDVNKEVEKQLRPYFESRAAAVIDIPTDMHIAAEGPLDHSALQPATRRAAPGARRQGVGAGHHRPQRSPLRTARLSRPRRSGSAVTSYDVIRTASPVKTRARNSRPTVARCRPVR